MHVNYDKMLKDYKKNMETNLRGFSGGPPPFETWVPYDGDDEKSMGDLLSLAKESGQEVVMVQGATGNVSYHSERAKKVQDDLNNICKELKYTNNPLVVGLKNNVLTLDYEEMFGVTPFHLKLITLEGHLNKATGQKFDIQTLNVDDKNRRDCSRR